MNIGIMMGTAGSSTIDDLVGMAKSAEEVGLHHVWLANILGAGRGTLRPLGTPRSLKFGPLTLGSPEKLGIVLATNRVQTEDLELKLGAVRSLGRPGHF